MAFASGLKKMVGARSASAWVKRSLQAAVLVAISASVPEAWSAGGHIQVTNVAAGSATFSQVGSLTTVRTGSNNTIINYSQLSVGSGETLDFVQPTSHSRVLNRISGTTPTRIDGTLESNGIVYLVNPAGVMFGQGAVIDVGQFFAAAAHLSDANFMHGVNQFTGSSGSVQNYGTISAQQVHLVGLSVGNFGEIVAGQGGVVTMTSGDDVFIGITNSPVGSPHVMVKVSANKGATKDGTGVTNGGNITANGGQVSLGAGDLYAAGIYNSGTIKGANITLDSGANTNVSAGTIDASSAKGKGGTVQMLGDNVTVASGGTIDASGKTGGGTILVGGALHGGGGVETASATVVGTGATLKADAGTNGNGGLVVVWSQSSTQFSGTISAQGGTGSGNGGFAEVSSKQDLTYAGSTTTLAVNGQTGTLLLDPTSLEIVTGGGTNKVDPTTFDNSATNVSLSATGDITFTSPVALTVTGVGITAVAGGNIAVNNSITTKAGFISLSAGDSSQTGFVTTGAIAVGGTLNTTVGGGNGAGANITLRGNGIDLTGNPTINAGTGGQVQLYSNAAANAIELNSGSAGAGNFAFGSNNGSSISGSALVIGEAGVYTGTITSVATNLSASPTQVQVNSSGTGGLVLDNTTGSALQILTTGTLTVSVGSGGITRIGTGGTTTSDLRGGTISLTATGAGVIGTAAAPLQLNNTASNVTVSATTGSGEIGLTTVTSGAVKVTISASGVSTTGNVSITPTGTLTALGAVGGANVTLTSVGAMSLTSVTATGNLSIIPTGDLTATGSLSATGDFVANVTGNISLAGAGSTTGNLSLTTTGSGNINSSAALTSGANLTLSASDTVGNTSAVVVAPAGSLSLTSTHAMTVTDNNSIAGNLTVLSAGGATTLVVNGDFTEGTTNIGSSGNTLSITTTGTGNINGGTGVLTGSTISLVAAGSIGGTTQVKVADTGALTLTSGSGDAIDVAVGNNLSTNNLVLPSSGSGRVITLAVAGNLTVNSAFGRSADDLVLSTTTTKDITSTGTNGITGGNVSLNSAGNVSVGNITASGNLSVVTGAGNINQLASTTWSGGNVSLNSGGDIGDARSVSLTPTGTLSLLSADGNDITATVNGNLLASKLTLPSTGVTGRTVTLTIGGNFTLDANEGLATDSYVIHTTGSGGIVGGSGTLTGNDLTLNSAQGIGNSTTAVLTTTSNNLSLTTTGASAAGNIFVSETNSVTLGAGGDVTISTVDSAGSPQTVSLTSAGGITIGANVTLANDSLVFVSGGTGFTIDTAVKLTGANVSIATDTITFNGTGNISSTGTVAIAQFTSGTAISLTNTATGTGLTINNAVLSHITTGALAIGNSGSGAVTVGASGDGALVFTSSFGNLTITTPSTVTFGNSLTLKDNSTLTFNGPAGVVDTSGSSVIIGGTGTLVFTTIAGDIGASGAPLLTQVAQLGGVTGAGHIFLDNTGGLTVSGVVNLISGSDGSFIETQSPLTINSAVTMAGSFTLAAGASGSATDNLTISANVTSSTNGTVTLTAGNNISQTTGTITGGLVILTADENVNGSGNINQSGGNIISTSVQATATTGISLAGSTNTIPVVTLNNSASGTIALTTGGNLSITSVSQTGGGSITLIAGGNVTQTGTIIGSGANLIVQSHLAGGADITLTLNNNIGSGNITLDSFGAGTSTTVVGGNLAYTSASSVNVQSIATTGSVALISSSSIQDASGGAGIQAGLLTVTSTGFITLTNAGNTFTSLNVTDNSTSGASALAFTTSASGGLTITGITQTNALGSASITNSTGAITSTAVLTDPALTVSAKGGISLTNTSNAISSLSATNTTSGDIAFVDGTADPLTVNSASNSGGGNISLTSGSGITFNGTVTANTGNVSVTVLNGGGFTANSITSVTGGNITYTADNMSLDAASTTHATSGNVVLMPDSPLVTISFNASDSASVLGITNAELGTITASTIQIGSLTQVGNINGSGTINLPTNVLLMTGGNVDLSAVTITTSPGAKLTVDHTGTFTLSNATLSGGLADAGDGAPIGGNVTLDNGTVSVGTSSVTFNSPVLVVGTATLTTTGAGTDFTFQSTVNGTLGDGTENLTITAGTGTVTFAGAVGTVEPLGAVQVVSSSAINLGGSIVTNGGFVSLTSSGAITLNSNVTIDTTDGGANFLGNNIQLLAGVTGGANSLTLTGGSLNGNISVTSFTSTGNFTASGKQFTNSGTIAANVISITNARPTTINGNLTATGNLTVDGSASPFSTFTDTSSVLSGANVTITQSGAVNIGGNITSGGNVALTSSTSTVTTGNITDTGGPFTSSGTDFTSNGNISATSISITNTGIDTFNGQLTATGSGNLSVMGAASIGDAGHLLSGGNVTLTTTTGNISVTGAITSGANVTLTSAGSFVLATGLVTAPGTIVYTAKTDVTTGNITDSGGSFTSQPFDGVTLGNFTNGGDISAVGISISNNGGADTLNGKLLAGTGNLSVTGGGSIGGTVTQLTGGNVTLTTTTGNITLTGNITSGQNITLTSTGSFISATGTVIASNTTPGSIVYTAKTDVTTGNITDTGGSFTTLAADGVTVGNFTNGGDISAVGISISNNGGTDALNGKLLAGTGNLSVTGGSSIGGTTTQLTGGNVTLTTTTGNITLTGNITSGQNITLTSAGSFISETGNVTASNTMPGSIVYTAKTNVTTGNITDTGGSFTSLAADGVTAGNFTNGGDITAVGISISNNGGTDTLNGKLLAGAGNLSVTGGSSIGGTVTQLTGGNVALTTTSGNITLTGNITSGQNITLTSTGSFISATGNVTASNTTPGSIVYTAKTDVTTGNITDTGGSFTSMAADGITAGNFTNGGDISAVGISISNNGGTDTLNGKLLAGTGALSVTGGSSIGGTSTLLSGNTVALTSSGNVSLAGNITSVGALTVTSSASFVLLTGPVTSQTGDATITASGNANVGNVTSTSGNVSVSGSTVTLAGSTLGGTSGNVTVTGAATLTTNVAASGNVVKFSTSVDGAGEALSVTANQTIFNGNVGALASLSSVTVTGTSPTSTTVFGGGVTTANAATQLYGDAVTLTAGFTFTGKTITFSKTLNPTVSTTLTVNGNHTSPGILTFSGAVGNTTAFGTITIQDFSKAVITPSMTAVGNIGIGNSTTLVPVTLTGSILSTAGAVTIPGDVTLGAGANSVTSTAPSGTVGIILGNINGTTTSNLTLISNGPGNGNISIIVGSIGSSGRIGDVDFQTAPAVGFTASQTNLGGNITAHNVTFEDNSTADPSSLTVPVIGTVSYLGTNGLTINASGNFTMEQNQKLTALSNLTIQTSGGLIAVGDLSAFGTITLDAGGANNPIHIIDRAPTKELRSNGTFPTTLDNGTDLVSSARGSAVGFSITGTVSVIQPAGVPGSAFVTLASGNPQRDINTPSFKLDPATRAGNKLKIVPEVDPIPAITLADLTVTGTGGTPLPISGQPLPATATDLAEQGQSEDVANITGTIIPADVATVQIDIQYALSGALKDALNELGIYARDVNTDETISYLLGHALYNDVPQAWNVKPTDYTVATNRLPYSPVLPLVEAYERLFFKVETGKDGKQHKVPQQEIISKAIAQAWIAYTGAMKDKATGDHFRGYLEANAKNNPKFALALDDINQLRDLLVQIKNLGLTANEFNVAQSSLLSRVRPQNINEADFLAAITGPSTLTRGQTAMK